LIPNTTIRENDVEESADPSAIRGTINLRNPKLKPWTAHNYDLSAEYYTDNGGVISAGVFRKEIADFFGSEVRLVTAEELDELGLDPRYVGWNLTTAFNSGDARVTGGEFNVRQSLTPLGKYGRFFSVFANATKLKLEGSRTEPFDPRSREQRARVSPAFRVLGRSARSRRRAAPARPHAISGAASPGHRAT
jgi:outer membrane receptor protein involved in Fe transport